MKELVLGAGNSRQKQVMRHGEDPAYTDPTYVDIDPNSNPTVLWDLNVRPLPFEDHAFDEIHAYSILEHLGTQGDWRAWFEEWDEYYRILKPGGLVRIACPRFDSPWAWGDPGHTRVISAETLTFLSQQEYRDQVGITSMTDYRHVYRGDFRLVGMWPKSEHDYVYILESVAR